MKRKFAVALIAAGLFALANASVAFAQEPVEAECEFPAQVLQLERNVNITNTAPVLEEVVEDLCGNVISYTERPTHTLSAGDWVPAQPGEIPGAGEITVVGPDSVVVPQVTPGVVFASPASPEQEDGFLPQILETDAAPPDSSPGALDPLQTDEGIGDLYASVGCIFVNGNCLFISEDEDFLPQEVDMQLEEE